MPFGVAAALGPNSVKRTKRPYPMSILYLQAPFPVTGSLVLPASMTMFKNWSKDYRVRQGCDEGNDPTFELSFVLPVFKGPSQWPEMKSSVFNI